MLLTLVAATLFVFASACIAELSATSALHVVAPLRLFDPHLAFGALLEFCALGITLEGLVIIARILALLVLLACYVSVPFYPTLQTIVLGASGTVELLRIVFRVIDECVFAIRCRTPGSVAGQGQRLIE